MDNSTYQRILDERRRIGEAIAQEGTGAGAKWNNIATAAMGGMEEARQEIERLLGHPVRNMGDYWNVMVASYDMMSYGEREISGDIAEQILRTHADPSTMANEYLANKVGALRRKAGMTQAQLSKATGVTLSLLQKYENGQRSILGARAETALKIAKALGVTVEEMLSDDGDVR